MSHKPNMSTNTIFAGVLVAGIIGMLAGFISRQVITPEFPHEDAFPIEVTETSGAGGSAGPTGPEPILALLATADVAKGESLSKQCAACHDFSSGGPDRVGPNLHGVVGRPKGSHGSFAYSEDLKAKGGSWTFEDLNHFLWKPKSFVAGTKMNFIGLKKPEDRAAIIAWLNTQGSNLPMPSQAAIDAEQAELAPATKETEAAPAAADVPGSAEATEGTKPAPTSGDETVPPSNVGEESVKVEKATDKATETAADGGVEKAVTPLEATKGQ